MEEVERAALSATERVVRQIMRIFAGAAIVFVPMTVPFAASAEEAEIEEQVVTGVRGKPRTCSRPPVPIDVFGEEASRGCCLYRYERHFTNACPSYGVRRQPISDGASFIRPATMRGLPTDKTLVLVNGKRRHRAALVGIGGSGSQGPDLATIPVSP